MAKRCRKAYSKKPGESRKGIHSYYVYWSRAQVVAAGALTSQSNDGIVQLLQGAREAYESVRSDRLSEFHRTQFAENLILLDDFSAAKSVLLEGANGSSRVEFGCYRAAQAELGLGNLREAMEAIDQALSRLKDLKLRSAFLETRYNVRSRMADEYALEDLEAAIPVAVDDKYRIQLVARRDAAKDQ